MYAQILFHLNDLDSSSIDIESSAVVSVDGLVMAATLPDDMDIDHMGAISAGAFLLGHHTSKKCASGMLEQVLIKCSNNQIIMTYVGEQAILTVIAKPYANLEHLFSNIKGSIDKIKLLTN